MNSRWRVPGVSTVGAAEAIARRVQSTLARPFAFAQQEMPLSASIGISLFPGDALDAETLVKHAEAAMHHAKKTGQGGVEFFKKSISTRAAKHFSLEADLGKALERREFTLNYQPRLALDDLRSRRSKRCCDGRIRNAVSCRRMNSSRSPSRAA